MTPSSPWCTSAMRDSFVCVSARGASRRPAAPRGPDASGRPRLGSTMAWMRHVPGATPTDVDLAALRRSTPRRAWTGLTCAPTPSPCSGAGSTTRSPRGSTSRTRWSSDRRLRTGVPRRGWCCSRASDRARLLHQLRLPQGRRSSPRTSRLSSLLFPWHPLSVRCGSRESRRRARRGRGRAYFAGRPRGSQLGAWASPQSKVGRRSRASSTGGTPRWRRGSRAGRSRVPPYWGGYPGRARRLRVLAGAAGPAARPAGYRRSTGWADDAGSTPSKTSGHHGLPGRVSFTCLDIGAGIVAAE